MSAKILIYMEYAQIQHILTFNRALLIKVQLKQLTLVIGHKVLI